jgi:hypothetical protein
MIIAFVETERKKKSGGELLSSHLYVKAKQHKIFLQFSKEADKKTPSKIESVKPVMDKNIKFTVVYRSAYRHQPKNPLL